MSGAEMTTTTHERNTHACGTQDTHACGTHDDLLEKPAADAVAYRSRTGSHPPSLKLQRSGSGLSEGSGKTPSSRRGSGKVDFHALVDESGVESGVPPTP
jgi:hypothetical protein